MKLTEAQRNALAYLACVKEYDGPPTPPEISRALGHASYWAAEKIASLEKRGLVERLGQSFTGGNCYRVSEVGRLALDAHRQSSEDGR